LINLEDTSDFDSEEMSSEDSINQLEISEGNLGKIYLEQSISKFNTDMTL
jgi:hypothetical protein